MVSENLPIINGAQGTISWISVAVGIKRPKGRFRVAISEVIRIFPTKILCVCGGGIRGELSKGATCSAHGPASAERDCGVSSGTIHGRAVIHIISQ